ncbi:MAG: hypothetical protein O3A46_05950 [Candidatus Poribacteria bacterium]|nr:hypothetical protein [Candidatus Poribacteria bacterium]
MTCEEALAQLPELSERDLDPKDSFDLTDHLVKCPECERDYRQYRELNRLLDGYSDLVRSGAADHHGESATRSPSRLLRRWLTLRVPVWVPTMCVVTMVVYILVGGLPGDNAPNIGDSTGSNAKTATLPLASDAVLEFLIHPDTASDSRLAASIETIESYLEKHPQDYAMQAKLMELSEARLRLPTVRDAEREALRRQRDSARDEFRRLVPPLDSAAGGTDVTP